MLPPGAVRKKRIVLPRTLSQGAGQQHLREDRARQVGDRRHRQAGDDHARRGEHNGRAIVGPEDHFISGGPPLKSRGQGGR